MTLVSVKGNWKWEYFSLIFEISAERTVAILKSSVKAKKFAGTSRPTSRFLGQPQLKFSPFTLFEKKLISAPAEFTAPAELAPPLKVHFSNKRPRR